jgi:hypothetical protein
MHALISQLKGLGKVQNSSDAPGGEQEANAQGDAGPSALENAGREVLALLPKLADARSGETKVSGGQPLFGAVLAQRALDRAAAQVAAAVKTKGGDHLSVLVTCDPELATSDAAYLEVVAGLEQLTAAADQLLAPPVRELVAAPVLGAVTAALPSLLALLSAHRSITTTSAPGNDLAAAASVAGALVKALPGAAVWYDGFRTLPSDGTIYRRLESLRDRRRGLAASHPGKDHGAARPEQAARADAIDSLAAAIDRFLVSVTVVPPGARQSMLTHAVLREGLHSGEVGHVLLVQGGGGSSSELVQDRPLLWKDTFCVVTTSSVTYLLIRASDGRVIDGGITSGTATLRGKIGDRIIAEQTD